MVTIIRDNRAQADYMLEDIMTKQGVRFMEELHNAPCLNIDMNIQMVLMQDMFKWRL
ncbi:hypothetical protein Hanom_Chr12g01107431 [Helianthus anomalus]